MEERDLFYALAALPPRKQPSLPIGHEAGLQSRFWRCEEKNHLFMPRLEPRRSNLSPSQYVAKFLHLFIASPSELHVQPVGFSQILLS
jgi:hypothetical protein